MKILHVTVALFYLAGCVPITRHHETELQLEECRKKLEISGYHLVHAPRAASGMEIETTVLIVVTDEHVVVNGEQLSGPDLSDKLTVIRDETPDIRLLISVEPDVPYGKVLEFMDQARKAGFRDYHLGVGHPEPVEAIR